MKPLSLAPALLICVAAGIAIADTGLKNGGVTVGPVRDIDAALDGGLTASRASGSTVGSLRCASATANTPGCVDTGTQTLAGNKTFSGDVRVVGHVHASLTACDGSHKGTWQTCTTHNAPVFCDGTTNQELLGTSSAEKVLAAAYVNGVPTNFWGAITLGASFGWTVTALSGIWRVGTGAGSLPMLISDGTNLCTCTVDCDTPAGRTACSGSCTYAASSTLYFIRGTSTCTTLDPAVGGNLYILGTSP